MSNAFMARDVPPGAWLMTDLETAAYLGVGRSKAREIASKAGAVVKFGRSKRNRKDLIDQYVNELTQKAESVAG